VAALVEGDEMDYLDAVRDGSDSPWRGVLVALTTRRVIRATVTGTVDPSDSVVCWPRGSLVALRLDGPVDPWHRAETGLPRGASLRLKYGGRRRLTIPLDPTDARSTAALGAVLPSLLDDLDEPQLGQL
jgi:hypothetical protein